MKPKFLANRRHPARIFSLRTCVAFALMASTSALYSADILWSSSGGSAWLTGSNWTDGSVPSSTDVAQFGANPTGTGGVGINFNSTTNAGVQTNGQRIQEVGAIEITSARASSILVGNSSGTSGATGTLRLTGATVNSVANTILRNNSNQLLTIQNTQGSGNQTMALELGNATNNIVQITGTGGITLASDISGTGHKLTRQGAGTGILALSGTNTYDGGTDISGGLVQFTTTASMPSTGNIDVSSGGGIIVNVGGAGRFTNANSGAGSFGGILAGVGPGSSTITYDGDVTIGIDISTSGATTYSGVIADVAGSTSTSLFKINGQNLDLTGTNTYSGKTILGGGSVRVTSFGNIGDASSPLGTGSTIEFLSGGNLSFIGNTVQSSDKIIDIVTGANATLRADGSGAGALTLTADINPTGGGNKTLSLFGANTNANTISGNISNGASGTLAVIKNLAGTWVLSGTNSYSGNTSVSAGVLNIRHANALGSTTGGTSVSSGGALEIQGGITVGAEALSLNGTGVSNGGALRNVSGDNTYGGLVTLAGNTRINSDSGTLTLSNTGTITGATRTLTVGGAGNTIIDSIIGTTTGTLTKEDGGTLTLAGNNTYTGATTVSAGTLLINGSLGNSAVSVSGSTATIGGTGTINGSLTVAADSFIEVVDFDNPLAVGGTITFGDGFGIANLLGIDWDSLDMDTPYTVLSTTQTFGVGDIADFGIGNAVAVGNTGRQAYFTNGSLAVVVIPEPHAALLGGLGLLALLRRRRA